MTGHWESKEQEDYFMELARQKQEQDEAEQRNYEYALEMENNKATLTPEQAAHYKMLAEAHQDTPGDLAAAYREIGRLLDEIERLRIELAKYANFINYAPYDNYPDNAIFHQNDGSVVTIGDLRKAALMLKDAS